MSSETERARKRAAQKLWKQNNPGRHRELNFKSKYGITTADRDVILAKQNFLCAACDTNTPGGKYKNWHMDHCHKTKKIRGVLCHNCNIALGHVKDNPVRLRALAAYLERTGA